MPNATSRRIDAVIALRNEVGHFLFPENLRAHRDKPKNRMLIPMSCPYKGQEIFTPAGLARFFEDLERITFYFRTRSKVFRQRERKNPKAMLSFT